jgi:hypothetical protein
LLADGKFLRKGICPPEYLGEQESHFEFIKDYLSKRGVVYTVNLKFKISEEELG